MRGWLIGILSMGAFTLALTASSCPAGSASLPPPDDPAFSQLTGDAYLQWPLHLLGAVDAWGYYPATYYPAATRPTDTPLIAVIDTGVDPAHPDFINAGGAGTAVEAGGQLQLSLARTFLTGDPTDDTAVATDEHGHGTHLAGIMAAAANNGLTAESGIAGLAYPARVLPVKVTSADGVARHADLARAISYAADHGASVILLGLSGPTWSQALQDAVDYAWERGCFLVAPAGDAMGGLQSFPAACPHVFGVGATLVNGGLAAYSNPGQSVALVAPGGDSGTGVYSLLPTYACTLRQDGASLPYGTFYGTGQAAAHLAAAAGLYLGARAAFPPTDGEGELVWQALEQAAAPLSGHTPGAWEESGGWGALDLTGLLDAPGIVTGAKGSLVGRVLLAGVPTWDIIVTAEPIGGGDATTASSYWPAGAYRLSDLPPGEYRVTASAGDMTGVWECMAILPGCDAPAVDFRLGDPAAIATVITAQLPTAAVRGRTMEVAITLENTGESTWRRRDGYTLRQVDELSPFFQAQPSSSLAPGVAVAPGERCTFALSLPVPDIVAISHVAWQLVQDGGQGRFGPIIEATISITSFLDVPADFWAVSEIEAAKTAGLVRGYEDFTYHPLEIVSRDQMAVYLARALAGGEEAVPPGPEQPFFPDVPADYWAYRHIEYVRQAGVVSGYPDGLYWPGITLDRGQMAVFIARALAGGEAGLASYTPPATPSFPDVPTEAWNYRHVEYIRNAAVTTGYPDGLYHPESLCTRDQMAVYLIRAFVSG